MFFIGSDYDKRSFRMKSFDEFLTWEKLSRDTIDFKMIYVDVADDLVSGLLLSQIIYWHLPNHSGRSKLKVRKEGFYWIAKGREDWFDEIRITAKQFDRCIKILEEKNLIVRKNFRFNGSPMVHIRLNYDALIEGVNSILTKREKPVISTVSEDDLGLSSGSPLGLLIGSKPLVLEIPFLPKGKIQIDQRGKTLTEITTKTKKTYVHPSDEQEGIESVSLEVKEPTEQGEKDLVACAPSSRSSKQDEMMFETVWELYPRKQDKKASLQAYIKAIKKHSHEDILNGVKGYQQECLKDGREKRFIKLGKTFFNNECYLDYIMQEEETKPKAQKKIRAIGESLRMKRGQHDEQG